MAAVLCDCGGSIEDLAGEACTEDSEADDLPDNPEPDLETLEAWEAQGGCEATDGCWVEPDGVCSHGRPSWLIKLGLI